MIKDMSEKELINFLKLKSVNFLELKEKEILNIIISKGYEKALELIKDKFHLYKEEDFIFSASIALEHKNLNIFNKFIGILEMIIISQYDIKNNSASVVDFLKHKVVDVSYSTLKIIARDLYIEYPNLILNNFNKIKSNCLKNDLFIYSGSYFDNEFNIIKVKDLNDFYYKKNEYDDFFYNFLIYLNATNKDILKKLDFDDEIMKHFGVKEKDKDKFKNILKYALILNDDLYRSNKTNLMLNEDIKKYNIDREKLYIYSMINNFKGEGVDSISRFYDFKYIYKIILNDKKIDNNIKLDIYFNNINSFHIMDVVKVIGFEDTINYVFENNVNLEKYQKEFFINKFSQDILNTNNKNNEKFKKMVEKFKEKHLIDNETSYYKKIKI